MTEFNNTIHTSTWRDLADIDKMTTADEMIEAGLASKAWPAAVELHDIRTKSGLSVPGKAIVAVYADGTHKAHGTTAGKAGSGRTGYTPLDPEAWHATIRAAVDAGAKPIYCHSLRGGQKILAQFEISGGNDGSGLRNYFNLADFLGGGAFIAGSTMIRAFCANTMAAFMRADGKNASRLRHTASINDRIKLVQDAIRAHIAKGGEMAELYREARETRMTRESVDKVLSTLFPLCDEEENPNKHRAGLRRRDEFKGAMEVEENFEGPTLASMWNGATWLVDRHANGSERTIRKGSDSLDSMMFGSRGRRIDKIVKTMITIMRPDGSEETVAQDSPDATEAYASHGRSLMDAMLA